MLVAMLAAATPAAEAQEPASVMIVFDGSGSMGAPLEGTRLIKHMVAKDAFRRALPKMAPATLVGLAAFGHRRGDCGDVEVIRQPEPLDAQRTMDVLDRVYPRGRGPLTAGLREAARSLPPAGRRTLLLVHDEADNCQQNVCALAEELRRAGIVAHVVGLAWKPDDVARMACLPQLTGGRTYNTRTPEQVAAAVEEVLRLASSSEPAGIGIAPPVAPARPSSPAPAVPATIPANAPPGLYLRAVLAPNTEPVSLPLTWTVYVEGEDGRPGAILFTGRATNPHVPAAPGRYVVEARDGKVRASLSVVLDDKRPTGVFVVLDAGTLHVQATAQKAGAPLSDAIITVSEAGQATEGAKEAAAGAPLAAFKGSEATALLPPGRYLVRVEHGLVRAERAVVVPAASRGRLDVALNAARILLSVAGRDLAGPGDVLTFSVEEDDPDAPRGRREVARSAARQADFVLPPGTYYVSARIGAVETRESLAVGPGDVVRRTLALAAGRLSLSTKTADTPQAPSEPVSYRIERLDGASPDVITTTRASPVLLLAAGRYRVEGRYGAMNARAVREVEIRSGQTQQVVFEHQSATVRLRLAAGPIPILSEVFWDIRDEAGAAVWSTGQPDPSAVLQAGRYKVRAEARGKHYERAIEVRAGETRTVELQAE
jgi:Ca-activated chloride channel family protein